MSSAITVSAADIDDNIPSLPDPLTLEDSLALARLPHPDIAQQEYALEIARNQYDLIGSNNDLEIKAKAEARYIEPPAPLTDLGREDHRAIISAEKVLYDFGRTGHQQQAAQENIDVQQLEVEKSLQLRRLRIMQSFFNVILADLQYNYDNEAMAIYYIQYDRAKERQELGQLSEIDVLQAQSEYMEIRSNRFRSETAKRSTRASMSLVLDRPSQLVSRFVPPALDYHKYNLIEVARLQTMAEESNLELQILRKQREMAMQTIKSLRSNRMPVLSAKAEAGVYSREIGTNDAWRLGVGVDIPLYQGGRIDYALATQQNRIHQIDLEIYQKKHALNQEILSLWLDIDALSKQKQSSKTEMDYRELYLDRARALYEMEVKTDLGDSMIALTKAAKYIAETEFEIAMKWEKMRYLTQAKLEDMRL